MSAVIKVGGVLLENPDRAAMEVLHITNRPAAIVHGGGVQITRMLTRMDVTSQFIDGLRVTDEKTLDAVATALLGEVHTSFVAALHRAGIDAMGIFGAVRAVQKAGPWGLVGTQVTADVNTLKAVIASGKTPVIPTLAMGPDSLLNVNGDETAAAVAIAIQPVELVFLTDVEGVRDAAGKTIAYAPHADGLLSSGFVSGGMIPKLRAVRAAMEGGVPQVRVGKTKFGGLGQ